jgi:hypothetical protein
MTPAPLRVYRDDGPLARALGALLAPRLPASAAVPAVAAALPLLVAIAALGDDPAHAVAGAVVAWLVLAGAVSAGRPHDGSFDWLVPGVLRLAEYAAILWIGAIAGRSSLAAGFALVAVLTFRHYDLVYRLRHRGVTTPRWVDLAGLGWDGRVLLAYVLLVAGALPAAYFVAAGVLGIVFVAESAAGWAGSAGLQQTGVYEEQGDEGQ